MTRREIPPAHGIIFSIPWKTAEIFFHCVEKKAGFFHSVENFFCPPPFSILNS